jgi:hypothetical protein
MAASIEPGVEAVDEDEIEGFCIGPVGTPAGRL